MQKEISFPNTRLSETLHSKILSSFQSSERGWSLKQCDDRFFKDLKKKCKCRFYKFHESFLRASCLTYAAAMYGAVRAGGSKFFDDNQPNSNCYRHCMIPLASPHVEVTE